MTPTPLNWLEVSKSAFFHNITAYKSVIGSDSLAAVIKSNAYGHDLTLMGRLSQEHPGVDWLCVANLSDAITLRSVGISKPILILSYIDAELEAAALNDISCIGYEKEFLDAANAVGCRTGKQVKVHIKIDTGVSRFGIIPHEAVAFVTYAKQLPGVSVEGIFTHFAQAQAADKLYTLTQQTMFEDVLQLLANLGITIPLRHCANSAATTILDRKSCNFFRVGAGLYGIWPSASVAKETQTQYPHFSLKQVLTWKSTIIGLRTIPANTSVGYDQTYKTTRQTHVALLPIGYFEGYDRRLSNTGNVLIRNQMAPVIGRVCMNVLLVDVTMIDGVEKGDHVTLLGDYDGIRPRDLAEQIQGFNPREIIARLHHSLPRILVP